MKEGLSLQEMAAEITRQSQQKADYLVDTRLLQMEPFGNNVYLQLESNEIEPLEINQIAHRQLGAHLKSQLITMTVCYPNIQIYWRKM